MEESISEIIKLEEELRLTMLNGDAEKLDELVDDSLTFVIPNGMIITKSMDLAGYKNKIQKISQIKQSEQGIKIHDNFAVVTVKADIVGTYNGVSMSGLYRFLRIWAKIKNSWRIVAGSSSIMA